MTEQQDIMEQEAPVVNMDSFLSKGPSGKEVQERKAEDKRVREHNKLFLDEAEMRLRNAQINTEMIETNVRAMEAFIKSETLRDEYLCGHFVNYLTILFYNYLNFINHDSFRNSKFSLFSAK